MRTYICVRYLGDSINTSLPRDPRWGGSHTHRAGPACTMTTLGSSRPQNQKVRDQGSAPHGLSPEITPHPLTPFSICKTVR